MKKEKQYQPPRWTHFLLRRRVHAGALEEIEGDLHELYQQWAHQSGQVIARLRYLLHILFYLRKLPRSMRKKQRTYYTPASRKPFINSGMFSTSLKIAWRQLVRSKGYAVINIGGLAVGMGAVLLIGLWVWDEFSFDRYHKNHQRLAQAWQMVNFDGSNSFYNSVPIPLAKRLREQYPQVEAASISTFPSKVVVTKDETQLVQTGLFVEADMPGMITLEMINGDINALRDVQSVLIAQSTAKALYGNQSPVGQVFRINDKADVKVAGVYRDLPANSSFAGTQFMAAWQLYTRMNNYAFYASDKWDENSFQLFVLLRNGVRVEDLSEKIRDIRMKMDNPPRYKPDFFLHPMDRWHLFGDFSGWAESDGLIKLVRLFAMAGIFVLVLACINFMNLSTARSEKRAREVGIRKTLGSQKAQLLYQFFSESILIAVLSLILCLLLAWLALPFFNEIASKQMHLPWTSWIFWVVLMAFTLFTGLLAGSYPALFLSSFQPVKVMKGVFKTSRANIFSRKALVVFQFTVSVALIIATIVVGQQLSHARNRPAGYNKQQLVELPMYTRELYGHYDVLRDDLLKTGVVVSMAQSEGSITADQGGTTDISWTGKTPGTSPLLMANKITHDYGHTIGWTVVTGRDFSREFVTDSASVVVNEAAMKLIGYKDPLNQLMKISGKEYRIIGVVADIIKDDPFRPVKPSLYTLNYGAVNTAVLRIAGTTGMPAALARVEQVFRKHSPAAPFDYRFVDESYAGKFATEARIGKLAGSFAGFAIFISLLGLFGLAAFMAEKRTREIGIRKVLGANMLQVWILLSKEFVLLAFLAILLAAPPAYYFMHHWLEGYTYRIHLSAWIFIAVAAGILVITILTVSMQAIRAALMNPVKSLRTD